MSDFFKDKSNDIVIKETNNIYNKYCDNYYNEKYTKSENKEKKASSEIYIIKKN